eukprot:6674011-Prymnesium_polylepis.1
MGPRIRTGALRAIAKRRPRIFGWRLCSSWSSDELPWMSRTSVASGGMAGSTSLSLSAMRSQSEWPAIAA